MADSQAAHAEHHGPTVKAYFMVFGALAVCTLLSFVFNDAARHEWITSTTSLILILGVAIIKAVLVATFFMHLITDWGRFYFIIIPVMILGTLMVVVLLPDIVIAWHHAY